MGSKTDYLETKVLNEVCAAAEYTTPSVVYSALFTVIPSDSTATGEVTTATSGYTRVATTFTTTAAATIVNATAITFATMVSGVTVVGWALYDAATAGNALYWATVTTLALSAGDQAVIAAGGIVITED